MAKIKSPLMSQSASGTIAGNITFSVRTSGQQVRFQKKQKDKITSLRSDHRTIFSSAITAWNLLTSTQKRSWNIQAKGQNLTGYNLFISIYIGEPLVADSYFGVAIFGESIFGSV